MLARHVAGSQVRVFLVFAITGPREATEAALRQRLTSMHVRMKLQRLTLWLRSTRDPKGRIPISSAMTLKRRRVTGYDECTRLESLRRPSSEGVPGSA
jgi:hypothetical protein